MEDIAWDPIRVPNYEAFDYLGKGSCSQPFLHEWDISFSLRPVKRNAFKPSFLLIKPQEMSLMRQPLHYRCRMSITEVMRRAFRSLLNCTPKSAIHLKLRRPPDHRKKDWRAAMATIAFEELLDGNANPSHKLPLLESILNEMHAQQTLDITQIPLMSESFPPHSLEVASVWTNMVFDSEVLHHLLHQQGNKTSVFYEESFHRDIQVWNNQFEVRPLIFEDYFNLSSSASLNMCPMNASVLPECNRLSDMLLSEVIGTKATFGHLSRSDPLISESGETLRLDRFDDELLQAFEFMRARPSHHLDLERIIQVASEKGTAQKLRRTLDSPYIMGHQSRNATWSCCQYSNLHPIMERELQAKFSSFQCISGTVTTLTAPKMVIDNEIPSQFLKLLLSLRNKCNLVAEEGLWCSGSQELMRKCRLQQSRRNDVFSQRSYVLRRTTRRDLFPLLPKSNERDGITMQGLEKSADELLRSYSLETETFLPLKVSLLESNRDTARREMQMRTKPIISHEKKISEKLNTFDTIKRTPSIWLSTKISKVGTKPVTTVSAQNCGVTGRLDVEDHNDEESTSQESLLDNILPSEGDEAEEQLVFQDLGGESESCKGVRDVNVLQNSMMKKSHRIPNQSNEEQKEVRLRVPKNFVCSVWAMRVAEHCIVQMPRGTILLPPCLSALPSLCIVIYSHLANRLQDERIAIICDAEADVSGGLRAYLENSFERKVSIEVIRRGRFSKEPRFASVNEYTAQVFILDSFDFALPSQVSLLLVLICQPHVLDSWTLRKSPRKQHFINPEWRHLSSILIAPLDSWVLFSAYAKRAEQISQELDMSAVLFVPEYDDVHHSVLLAKPRTLFLVPLRDASELVSVIDAHSSSILTRLREYIHEAQVARCSPNIKPLFISDLRDISVSLLRYCLEDQDRHLEPETCADLETAYFLRQARSYALYDGFDVASAFLVHCVSEISSKKTTIFREIMKKAEDITAENVSAERDHPIVGPVMDHIGKARIAFKAEAPSLFSIHRRPVFRPLIIANSTETVDGFRRGAMKAKLILEAGERDIAVCLVNDLASLRGKNVVDKYAKKVLDQMEQFSHIYHIIGDRDSTHPELHLPTQIVQLVHAGRTRLITVAVDERRDMEPNWTANEQSYGVMNKYLGDQRILAGIGRGKALWGLKWDTVQYMMKSLW